MNKKENTYTISILLCSIAIFLSLLSILLSFWAVGNITKQAKEIMQYEQTENDQYDQSTEGQESPGRIESEDRDSEYDEQSPEERISEEATPQEIKEKCDRAIAAEEYINEVREKSLAEGGSEEFMNAFEESFWEGFYEEHICDICN